MSKKNVYSCVGISSYVQPDNWNNWNVYAGYPAPNTPPVKKEKVSAEVKKDDYDEPEPEVLVLPAITEETNEPEVVKTEFHVNVNNTVESITQEIVITDENNTVPDSPEVPATLAATTPVPAEYYESHFDGDDKEIAVETVEPEKPAKKPGRPSIKVETDNKSVEKQTKKKTGRK